jgi:DNA processing protein
LIRQGAKLVETAQDIIDELGPLAVACQPTTTTERAMTVEPRHLDNEYTQLLEIIGFENTSIDRLVAGSGLTPAEVSSMLLQLEMEGYLASSPGGIYNRLK